MSRVMSIIRGLMPTIFLSALLAIQPALAEPRQATPEELAQLSPAARKAWLALTSPDPEHVLLRQDVRMGLSEIIYSGKEIRSLDALANATGWASTGLQQYRQRAADELKALQEMTASSPFGAIETDPMGRLSQLVRRHLASSGNRKWSESEAKSQAIGELSQSIPNLQTLLEDPRTDPQTKHELESRLQSRTLALREERSPFGGKPSRVDGSLLKSLRHEAAQISIHNWLSSLQLILSAVGDFYLYPLGDNHNIWKTPPSERVRITDLKQLQDYRMSLGAPFVPAGIIMNDPQQGLRRLDPPTGHSDDEVVFSNAQGEKFVVVARQDPETVFRNEHSSLGRPNDQDGPLTSIDNALQLLKADLDRPLGEPLLEVIARRRDQLEASVLSLPRRSQTLSLIAHAWDRIDPGHWKKIEKAYRDGRPHLYQWSDSGSEPGPPFELPPWLEAPDRAIRLDEKRIANRPKSPKDDLSLFEIYRSGSAPAGEPGFHRVRSSDLPSGKFKPTRLKPLERHPRHDEYDLVPPFGITWDEKGEIQIPVRDGYRLIGLETSDGRSPPVHIDERTGLAFLKRSDLDRSASISFKARFRPDDSLAMSQDLPPPLKQMEPARVLELCQDLRKAKLDRLAEKVEQWARDRDARQLKLDARDLASVFADSALYSYEPEAPASHREATGPFEFYSRFIDDQGQLCYQCTGGNGLLGDFLARYLGDDSPIEVIADVGYVERRRALRYGSAHRRVLLRWKGDRRRFFILDPGARQSPLDATPTAHKPILTPEERAARKKAAEEREFLEQTRNLRDSDDQRALRRLAEATEDLIASRGAAVKTAEALRIRNYDATEPMSRSYEASTAFLGFLQGKIPLEEAARRLGITASDSADFLKQARDRFATELRKTDEALSHGSPDPKHPGGDPRRLVAAHQIYEKLDQAARAALDAPVRLLTESSGESCLARHLREMSPH